jgi:hydroxymethylbilane synthase
LISDIKSGGIIATGSVRRRAQLLHIRNDLNFVDLRGNIETRFDKFYKSNWEGMILARAGVERLGLSDKISSIIPVNQMLPAACQGIIGIESRAESQFAIEIANAINDQKTYIEATAERAFLKAISGGCSNPIAAFAKIDGVCLKLEIMIASINGRFLYRDAVSGDRENPENLGRILADKVLNSGVLWTQE